jgi:hypothetical protein
MGGGSAPHKLYLCTRNKSAVSFTFWQTYPQFPAALNLNMRGKNKNPLPDRKQTLPNPEPITKLSGLSWLTTVHCTFYGFTC